MELGQVLKLMAQIQVANEMYPSWVNKTGSEILEANEENGEFTFIARANKIIEANNKRALHTFLVSGYTLYRVSVDVGGTFTDLVAFDEETGAVFNIKTPSTPKNPERGVKNVVKNFLMTHNAHSVRMIGHATTIATNALFGQIGLHLPRTGLVTTSGFKDVIEIGRQRRAEVYNLFFERPPILVKRRHRYELSERVTPDGNVESRINLDELDKLISQIIEDNIESIAIGFINSYANTEHEKKVKQAIRERVDIYITASHEISNEYREYERFSTAVVNSVLMPLIHTYITHLDSDLESLGLKTQLYVMQSNGGLSKSNYVSQKPATIVESGPAAGVARAQKDV